MELTLVFSLIWIAVPLWAMAANQRPQVKSNSGRICSLGARRLSRKEMTLKPFDGTR